MSEVLRLSPSKIEMYARCGAQYEFRYVLGQREPPGIAALVGRGVDSAVSAALIRKAMGEALPSVEEIGTMAADASEAEFQASSEILLNDEEKASGLSKVLGDAKDRSVRMAKAYRMYVAPLIRPEIDWKTGKPRVQHSWELEFPDSIILAGRSDVEEIDHGVRDTKTSAKPKPAAWVGTSLPLTAYAFARRSIDGHEEVPVRLDVLVDRSRAASKLLKGTDPAGVTPQFLVSVRNKADFVSYMGRVSATAKAIRAGIAIPAKPDDWICQEKFCGYWHQCPHARRPRHFATAAPEGIEREDLSGNETE